MHCNKKQQIASYQTSSGTFEIVFRKVNNLPHCTQKLGPSLVIAKLLYLGQYAKRNLRSVKEVIFQQCVKALGFKTSRFKKKLHSRMPGSMNN